MEVKKNSAADLENQRGQRLLLGLIVVLSLLYVAFEYTSSDELTDADVRALEEWIQDMDMTPVNVQKNMVTLQREEPRKVAARINIVKEEPQTQEEEDARPEVRHEGEAASEEEGEPEEEVIPLTTDKHENPLNFRIVEELPEFPGGAVELMKWLTKNLKYPASAKSRKIEGKVIAQFIVNADGTVSDIKVVKSLDRQCDNEVMRVLRTMPKWKPGTQAEKPCKTMVCIPVVFKL